jgi:integrase
MTVYMHRLTEEAGLRGGCHTLRHTYGNLMANEWGVNINALRQWMGHSSLEMTQRYVSVKRAFQHEIARLVAMKNPVEAVRIPGSPATAYQGTFVPAA